MTCVPVPRRPLPGPLVVGVLVVLAALIVAGRTRTYAEPLENDISGYAVLGHEVNAGRRLYADLWNNMPPLVVTAFAAAERAVGYGPGEVFLINVTLALTTLAAAYRAGTAAGGRTAGLFAAGLWTVLGGDALTQANQPNGEAFVNAALTWGFALMVTPPTTGRAWFKTGLAVGAAFALASLAEQHAVVICAPMAVAYAIAGGRGDIRRRAGAMALAAAVGVVTWAALFGYLVTGGRAATAIDELFGHNLATGGNLLANLAQGFRPKWLFPPFMVWAAGPAALVVAAAALGPRARPAGRWIVWAGWAVGTWTMVALPGQFFPHYYQCWIPPACVAGGWAAGRLLARPRHSFAGRAVVSGVLVGLLGRQLPPYRWPPEEWANRKYDQCNFVEQAYLGRRLATILRPGERFWILGTDNTVYFLARRSPPTGLLYVTPLWVPRNAHLWPWLMADLDRTRPALVLLSFPWQFTLPPGTPIMPWLDQHYVRVATNLTCPTYDLLVRRDDPELARRLLRPPPAPPFRREPYTFDR